MSRYLGAAGFDRLSAAPAPRLCTETFNDRIPVRSAARKRNSRDLLTVKGREVEAAVVGPSVSFGEDPSPVSASRARVTAGAAFSLLGTGSTGEPSQACPPP